MPSKFKNKLKTNEAENRQKIKNNNSKFTGSYKKKRVNICILVLLSNVRYSDYNLHILSLSR